MVTNSLEQKKAKKAAKRARKEAEKEDNADSTGKMLANHLRLVCDSSFNQSYLCTLGHMEGILLMRYVVGSG